MNPISSAPVPANRRYHTVAFTATVCNVIGVATLLFAIALYPGSARVLILSAMTVVWFSFVFTAASFAFQNQSSKVSFLSAGCLAVCAGGLFLSFSLSGSALILSKASENLNGEVPAIAEEASQIIRDNPLNVLDVIRVTRPAAQYHSVHPDQVALFRQAQEAGLELDAIDRVLSNGFVTREDKEELLEGLLGAYSQNPESIQLASLLTSMKDS